jgi:type I restriction enzyme, S subunit
MVNSYPSGWRQYSYGDVLSVRKELLPNNGVYPLYSLTIEKGVTPKSDRYEREFLVKDKSQKKYTAIHPNDLVFNPANLRWGAIARSKILFPVLASPIYEVLFSKDKDALDPVFLEHLATSDIQMQKYLGQVQGTLVERTALKLEDFLKIELLLPSIEEQKKISSILASVDAFIEVTEKKINKLEDLRASVMHKLLSSGVGHESYKKSDLGLIPLSWEVKKVSEVCKLSSGGTPDRSNESYWGGDIPWVKTGEINYAKITKSEEYITAEGLKNSSAKLVKAGAILMAMYGQGITRGRVAILGMDATINQACLAIEPKPLLKNKFLYYFLFSRYEYLRSLVQEGAQKNLSATIVKEVDIAIPPIEEQEKIVELLDAQEENISSLNGQLLAIKKLKKGLTQDLLTGKVRVSVD